MDINKYMCCISLDENSKLIKCLHILDINNKKLYCGYEKIGSQHNHINNFNFNYNFIFQINENIFNHLINLNFDKDIKNKNIKKFYNQYNLQEFFI